MADAIDPKDIDRRLVPRMIRKGELSEREVEKALKQLPDVADKAAPVDTSLEPHEGTQSSRG
jgi:hypothetical protein